MALTENLQLRNECEAPLCGLSVAKLRPQYHSRSEFVHFVVLFFDRKVEQRVTTAYASLNKSAKSGTMPSNRCSGN